MYCDATEEELRGARALRIANTISGLLTYHADAYPTRVWQELSAVGRALQYAREFEKHNRPGALVGAQGEAGIRVPQSIVRNLDRLRRWARNHPNAARFDTDTHVAHTSGVIATSKEKPMKR